MNAEAKTLAATRVEMVAARMWFEYCDSLGWPNGQPTWEELCSFSGPEVRRMIAHRELIRAQAAAALSVLDRLPAPVEGVGLETTAQERDQWRYSVNPFSGEDKERLLRDFNRIVSSLLKADLGRQDAIAAIDAKEAERLFWKERAHEGATAAVQVATELDAIRAERDALKAALEPSTATKAAYIGEVTFRMELREGESREITVPWTTTKEIMAMIRAYADAALSPAQGGE